MNKTLLLFVSCTLLLLMCTSEISVENEELYGKWKVVSGERNGQIVNYFSGFFIEFQNENKLQTNINQASESEAGTYEINKNKIIQKTESGELNYEITSFDDTGMTVLIKMNGDDLKFVLKKDG